MELGWRKCGVADVGAAAADVVADAAADADSLE
jgi:hypothetical protein